MQKLTDQEAARREKLKHIAARGEDPYPARVSRSHSVESVLQDFEQLRQTETVIRVVGRVRAFRLHGGALFLDLDDGTGTIQLYATADTLGASFPKATESLDLGDFVQAGGIAFTTKRGQRSIKVTALTLAAKSLRPLPDKRHGLADTEIRYRHRELDLIANPETRQTIRTRGLVLNAIRTFLTDERFLEVETPILQPIPGGANARPFVTHHQALNVDLFLRIAPELYLKRLVIGGLERVFEIARCFRNEGIDHLHNPEFTQVELYAAYTDYQWMMELTERMLRHVVTAIHGKTSFPFERSTITIPNRIPRMTFRDMIIEHGGPDIATVDDRDLTAAAKKLGVDLTPKDHRASIIDGIFKTVVRPKISQPIFVIDHPIELSPLAKKKSDDPRFVERFQLLIAGSELCNAFSELNDPIDQRQRFVDQEKLRRQGDDEAQRIDEEYLAAMEYGLPPTSGLGLGVDRLIMLMTNQHSIKEVIAFPTLKPER